MVIIKIKEIKTEMKRSNLLPIILVLIYIISACSGKEGSTESFADGQIEIKYDFVESKKIEPSFQTVIWLENEKGKYLKTFLVTEYLSMGGYSDSTICPDWQNLVSWESVSDEEYDAITSPTPPLGANTFKIDCEKEKIKSGKYRLCVQTHIDKEYNILYCGVIEVGGENKGSVVKKVFVPKELPGEENTLSNVSIRYIKK